MRPYNSFMLKSAYSIVRKAIIPFMKTKRIINTPRYYFSATQNVSLNQFLKEKIETQIKFEQQNAPDNKQLIQSIVSQNWKLKSSGMIHELTKNVGNKIIDIVFVSKSPSYQQNQTEQQKQEQEQQEQDSLPFIVYVRNGNTANALCANFLINNGQISLDTLNFTEDYETHKSQHRFLKPSNQYQGPNIESLDDKLLSSLINYFQQLALSNNVIQFIYEYSQNSEHPFYVQWLKQIKQFI